MDHPQNSAQSREDKLLSRRTFLQAAGAVAVLGSSGPVVSAVANTRSDINVILLFLVGGPSHLDTWDMKPDAPESIRGPFCPIATRVPGLAVSEIFPRLARITDKIALVRSIHHEAAAVHETGLQLLQTGRLGSKGLEHPSIGCVMANVLGPRNDLPASVVLPGPISPIGGNMPHGQSAGSLGRAFDPIVMDSPADLTSLRSEPEALRVRYGNHSFGESCLLARRLVERGVRFVTVNMYRTVFNPTTWDAHGSRPFSTLEAYRDEVGPTFDAAYTTLIEDLYDRGMLETTIVMAVGEFGRTPRINDSGGRDHHPGCWTGLFAGGPIQGGRVVGSSDATGESPKDRPVSPAEIAATIYHGTGIALNTRLLGPNGTSMRIVDDGVEPIRELF